MATDEVVLKDFESLILTLVIELSTLRFILIDEGITTNKKIDAARKIVRKVVEDEVKK